MRAKVKDKAKRQATRPTEDLALRNIVNECRFANLSASAYLRYLRIVSSLRRSIPMTNKIIRRVRFDVSKIGRPQSTLWNFFQPYKGLEADDDAIYNS